MMKSAKIGGSRKARKTDDAILREHLVNLLRGRGAHVDFEKAIAGLPAELRGARHEKLTLLQSGLQVPPAPVTPWRLLEHMRIAQWDILEFSRDAKHVSPEWPEGYWPAGDGPANAAAWEASVKAFRRDLAQMEALVKNPKTNLYARIPHGTGQTILREALLVADHNSYHVGQMVLLRRLLGAWKGG
jgi:hypothetical protein